MTQESNKTCRCSFFRKLQESCDASLKSQQGAVGWRNILQRLCLTVGKGSQEHSSSELLLNVVLLGFPMKWLPVSHLCSY